MSRKTSCLRSERRIWTARRSMRGDVVKTRDWEDGRRWLIGTVEYDEEDCGYSINFDTGDPKHEGLAISFMASPDCKVLGHRFEEKMQKLLREQDAPCAGA